MPYAHDLICKMIWAQGIDDSKPLNKKYEDLYAAVFADGTVIPDASPIETLNYFVSLVPGAFSNAAVTRVTTYLNKNGFIYSDGTVYKEDEEENASETTPPAVGGKKKAKPKAAAKAKPKSAAKPKPKAK